jgi:hypothetical protein
MATASEIQALITALEARIAAFAGVRGQQFSDQSTTFSLDDAHKELSRLRSLLQTLTIGSTTRYAATSKGV